MAATIEAKRQDVVNLFSKLHPLAGGLAYAHDVERHLDRMLKRSVFRLRPGSIVRYPAHEDITSNEGARQLQIHGRYFYVQLRPLLRRVDYEFSVTICNKDCYQYKVTLSSAQRSTVVHPPRHVELPLPQLSPDAWHTIAIDLHALLFLASRGRDGPATFGWLCGIELNGAAAYRGVLVAPSAAASARHKPVLSVHAKWPASMAIPDFACEGQTLTWCPAPPAALPGQVPAEAPAFRSRLAGHRGMDPRAVPPPTLPQVRPAAHIPAPAPPLFETGRAASPLDRSVSSSEEGRARIAARSPYRQGTSPTRHENPGVVAARARDLEVANLAVSVRSIRESGHFLNLPVPPVESTLSRASQASAISTAAAAEPSIWDEDGDSGNGCVPPRFLYADDMETEQVNEHHIDNVDENDGAECVHGEHAEHQEQEEEEEEPVPASCPVWQPSAADLAAAQAEAEAKAARAQETAFATARSAVDLLRKESEKEPEMLRLSAVVGLAGSCNLPVGHTTGMAWLPGAWDSSSYKHRAPQLVHPIGRTLVAMDVHSHEDEQGQAAGPPTVSRQTFFPGSPHPHDVCSLALAPGGALLASASVDQAALHGNPLAHAVVVAVWDVRARECIAVFSSETHGCAVGLLPPSWCVGGAGVGQTVSLSFSANGGGLLAIGGRDDKARGMVTVLDVSGLLQAALEKATLALDAEHVYGGGGPSLDATWFSESTCAGEQGGEGGERGGRRHGPGLDRLVQRKPLPAWKAPVKGFPAAENGLLPLIPALGTTPSGAVVLARHVLDGSQFVRVLFSPHETDVLFTLCDGSSSGDGLCMLRVHSGKLAGSAIPLPGVCRAGVRLTDVAIRTPDAEEVGFWAGGIGVGQSSSSASSSSAPVATCSVNVSAPGLVATGAGPAQFERAGKPAAGLPTAVIDAALQGLGNPAAAFATPAPSSIFVSTSGGTLVQIGYDSRRMEGMFQLHDGVISAVAVSARFAATAGGEDGLLRVWPLDFSSFVMEAGHVGPALGLAMGHTDRLVAVSSGGPMLTRYKHTPSAGSSTTPALSLGVLDIASQRYAVLARGHAQAITAVAVQAPPEHVRPASRPSSQRLQDLLDSHFGATCPVVSASEDETIRVWHRHGQGNGARDSGWQQTFHFHVPGLRVASLAYHPLIGHPARIASLLHLADAEATATEAVTRAVPGTAAHGAAREVAMAAHRAFEAAWAGSLDACNAVAVGFSDGSLRILHVPSLKVSAVHVHHDAGAAVQVTAFTPDGMHLFSAGLDGKLIQYGVVHPCPLGVEGTDVAQVRFTCARSYMWDMPRHALCAAVSLSVCHQSGLVALSCGRVVVPNPTPSKRHIDAKRAVAPLLAGRETLLASHHPGKGAIDGWGKGGTVVVLRLADFVPVGRVTTLPPAHTLQAHTHAGFTPVGAVTCLTLLPAGSAGSESVLAAGTDDGRLVLWAVDTDHVRYAELQGHNVRGWPGPAGVVPPPQGWSLPVLITVTAHTGSCRSLDANFGLRNESAASGLVTNSFARLISAGGPGDGCLRTWDAAALVQRGRLQEILEDMGTQEAAGGRGWRQNAAVELLDVLKEVRSCPLASRKASGRASGDSAFLLALNAPSSASDKVILSVPILIVEQGATAWATLDCKVD